MMNPELKVRWLAALRSGSYRQARKSLQTVPPDGQAGFCCLGVLCDLIAPDHWDWIEERENEYGEVYNITKPHQLADGEDDQLSPEAMAMVGMSESEMHKLIAMNDGVGSIQKDSPPMDFLTIANWIESNL